MRKKIYILLDILLIVGALVAVATIDGGRYWSNGVTVYQSANAATNGTGSQQAASGVSSPENNDQAATNCLMYTNLAIPEWAAVNSIIAEYNAHQTVEDSNGNQTAACK